MASPSYGCETTPEWGAVRFTCTVLNLEVPSDISGMAKARILKFCAHVACIKWDNKLPLTGCGQGCVYPLDKGPAYSGPIR